MSRPRLAVVGKGDEADKGDPELIALLERMTLEARSGQIVAISALVERVGFIELSEYQRWDSIYASGAHQWASIQALSEIETEE